MSLAPEPPAVAVPEVPVVAAVPAVPDLRVLLDLAATGDEDAFARLYDATAARVFGLVLRVVRDPVLAERVTLDVYLSAWRTSSRRTRSGASAEAWLMDVAHRHAVDGARAAESSPTPVGRPAASKTTAPATPRGVQVATALDALAPDHRDTLELTCLAGWTHAETTALLGGAGPDTVRDALLSLRELVGDPAP